MPMGRPPKPAEQKRALGNPGKRALPAALVALPAAEQKPPTAPRGLERDGKAAWKRLWTVGKHWLSPASDYAVLERLCRGYDEAAGYRKSLAEEGYTAKGSMGQVVAHPAVGMLRTLNAELARLESLCGFTPSDRSRLGIAEVTRESKLDQLLRRQREGLAAAGGRAAQ